MIISEMGETGYRKGHPWYYLLGGKPAKLKEIREEAHASGYGGFMADQIDKADQMPEPKRSQALRKYRKQVTAELSHDVRFYRIAVRDLHRYQAEQKEEQQERHCHDVHVAVSLKYCHLYNDFAHLHVLDDLLEKQRDLFDI